jgi:titin
VLPEAPSSLNASGARGAVKLTWQVHGGDPTGSVVERRVEDAKDGRETWKKIANLAAGTVEYSDATVRSGQRVAYRVRAVNAEGESAYSNIVRMTFSTK